eukprot:7559279-Alexandrium_andersonii.AAC.1
MEVGMCEPRLPGLRDMAIGPGYRPQEPPSAVALAGRDNRPGAWSWPQDALSIQANVLRPKVLVRS